MTAPTTLPAEVERIVAALAAGPDDLAHVRQSVISDAFRLGLIAAEVKSTCGRTVYVLRKVAVAP